MPAVVEDFLNGSPKAILPVGRRPDFVIPRRLQPAGKERHQSTHPSDRDVTRMPLQMFVLRDPS